MEVHVSLVIATVHIFEFDMSLVFFVISDQVESTDFINQQDEYVSPLVHIWRFEIREREFEEVVKKSAYLKRILLTVKKEEVW